MYRTGAARAGALLMAAAGVAALGACGNDTEGAGTSTTVTIAATSYVTRQPATTTTTGGSTGDSTASSDGTSPEEQQYTVQPNDGVGAIAALYEVDPEELANYNQWPEGINHPLFVGDIVKIPPGGKILTEDGGGVTTDPPTQVTDDGVQTTDDPDTTTGTTRPDDCSEGSYTIVEGDFPTAVAQKFDVTLEDLTAANAGTPGYESFYVGLDIVIPAPSDC